MNRKRFQFHLKPNQSRFYAHVLFESVVAVGIFSMLIHMQWPLVMETIRCIQGLLTSQKCMVERLDIHHALMRDLIQTSMTHDSKCCFKNQVHLVCYSISNHHVQRRKKKHDSLRFYTHTIGNHQVFESMVCESNGKHVRMVLKTVSNDSWDWMFQL